MKFSVITVCGSMRFYQIMLKAACELTADGYIVLMPFVADYGKKLMLDEMHKRKIDMSDRIVVVTDHTGYVGQSTISEIRYATDHEKPVDWYATDRYIKSNLHEITEDNYNEYIG